MTPSQRAALLDLCAAILTCDCATPDLRYRATNLHRSLVVDGLARGFFG